MTTNGTPQHGPTACPGPNSKDMLLLAEIEAKLPRGEARELVATIMRNPHNAHVLCCAQMPELIAGQLGWLLVSGERLTAGSANRYVTAARAALEAIGGGLTPMESSNR